MKKGFTLIELMIVVALIVMLSALTLPLGFGFFQETTFKDQVRNIENSLRKAQALAMTSRIDSDVGVRINPSECIIFERESFQSRRTSDIVIPFSVTLSVSIRGSIDEELDEPEIVFQKSTGRLVFPPEDPLREKVSIIVTLRNSSSAITINSQGKIERND